MSLTSQPGPAPLSFAHRLTLAAIAMALAALLAMAAYLRPAERGFGTHQQLGLPPCTSVLLFGRRCPSCGMTTAWAHLLDGSVVLACKANAGGALTGLCALLATPWMLLSAARGRWWLGCPSDGVWIGLAIAIASVTLLDWAWRLYAGW